MAGAASVTTTTTTGAYPVQNAYPVAGGYQPPPYPATAAYPQMQMTQQAPPVYPPQPQADVPPPYVAASSHAVGATDFGTTDASGATIKVG